MNDDRQRLIGDLIAVLTVVIDLEQNVYDELPALGLIRWGQRVAARLEVADVGSELAALATIVSRGEDADPIEGRVQDLIAMLGELQKETEQSVQQPTDQQAEQDGAAPAA
jgi:hypothetical protein